MSIKISALPSVSSLISSDLFPVNAAGVTSRIRLDALIALLAYQPLSAGLTTLSVVSPTATGLLGLVLPAPSVTSYAKVTATGLWAYDTPAQLLANISAQPRSSNLDLLAAVLSTTLGQNLLSIVNAPGIRYLRATGDGTQSVQQLTPAQVASDIRAFLAPPLNEKTTTSVSLTPNYDTVQLSIITALSTGLSIVNPAGSPSQGSELTLRITDNGTTRNLTWGAMYRGGMITSTTAGKTHYFRFLYNADDTKWDMVWTKEI